MALAPAAFAETHPASSHKPHAKGHAVETTSKKAKLRHAAEADEPPALPRKAHAEKASGAAKHHHAAVEEADAAPARSPKRRKATVKAVEEADAAPSKASRRHAKAAAHADEEADATPSKSAKRRGKTVVAEEADAAPAKAHGRHKAAADASDETPRARSEHARAEEGEGSSLIRADLKSTKACVAAHVRLHGRPHGSRARLALQRECAKEVEAARRRAEEELAIRTWSPPHGPLIYQGALPRGGSHAAEPPIAAPAVSTLPTEPATAPATPGADAALADASTPASASAPASGAATVAQAPPPPPSMASGIFNLFRRRAAPQRKPGEPAPTLAQLVGSDETRLKAELGDPELMRAEGDGALWTYRMPDCALYVFLGRDTSAGPWKVKGAQAGPLKRGGQAPDVDVCLKNGKS